MLFDRDSGFLVRMPRIEGQVRELRWRERRDIDGSVLDDDFDRDVPF